MLFNDDDDDSDAARATDDEDSNGEYYERARTTPPDINPESPNTAEDFYRNDYPDDDDVSSIDSEDSDAPRFGNEFFDDRLATRGGGNDYFEGDYGPSDDEQAHVSKPWDRQKTTIPEEEEEDWSEDEGGAERDRMFSELEHYVENR